MKENARKFLVKIITIIFVLSVFVSMFSIFSFATSDNAEESGFLGYSGNMTLAELEAETNTSKDGNGDFITPVNTSAPQITFLIPGYGCYASTWSNNYHEEIAPKDDLLLAYNEKSLVEKIRNYAGATVYLADITTYYPTNEKGPKEPGETEFKAERQSFNLYEFPELCDVDSCDKSCGKFHENLEEIKRENPITELPTNLTGHIVVLFDPEGVVGSNDRIYEQFNYVADKIIYDVKELNGGVLPTVNLVAHSRGGITAMQYTLDHPFLVDSLITMGTPFLGSFLGQFPGILNMIDMSADPTNINFTYGVRDILDSEKQQELKEKWNAEYDEKYSHINFCAVVGITTLGGIAYILENDTHYTSWGSNYIGAVLKHIDYLSDIHILPSNPSLIFYCDSNYKIFDDLFIDAASQAALFYKGVENILRCFEEDNIDLSMRAQNNTAIPHNLEPGDSEIHDYVLSRLSFGESLSDFTYRVKPDNTIMITGLGKNYMDTTVNIPDMIDGMFVREIGPYAFANRSDIQEVKISDFVTQISHHAFFNCTGLTSVTSQFGMRVEVIKDYAFAACTSLSTFEMPDCTREVGNYAFANTAITSVRFGTLMEDFSPSAFSGSALQGFAVGEYNTLYETIDGVLYNANYSKIIAYPSGKETTSFSVPNTVTEIAPYAFSGATHLESVNLGNINTVPHAAFAGCTSLENVIGTSVLLVANDSFHNTEFINAQTTVTLGDVLLRYRGTATTETLDYYSIASFAFQDNETLTSVKFTNKLALIDMFAFVGNSSLVDFYFKGNTVVNLEDSAFDADVNNRSFYVAEFLLDDYQAHTVWGDYEDELKVFSTTVQYDSNGGSSVPATTFPYYSQLTQEKLPTPTRIGYAFVGWIYGEGETQTSLSVGDYWLNLEDSVTLTASWIPSVYSPSLDPEGGNLSSADIVHTDDGVQLPIPTRTGYIFDGWYSEEDGAGVQFTVENGILLLEWDQEQFPTLYAEWIPVTYTITYVMNGGSNVTTNPTQYTIEDVITLSVPTRSGYRFNGWYTDSGFQFPKTTIENSTGNLILYAEWKVLYTVTFEHNYTTTTVYAIEDESITLPTFSAADAPVYLYVNGSTRLSGGSSYTVKGNIAFKSQERTLSESYQFIDGARIYCIYTYNQFRGIEDISKNSANKFQLMRNIDVSVTYSNHITDFYGQLDGNGFTLRYVREVVMSADSYGGNYALFKRNYGTLKNFTIDGLQIDIKTASNTSAQTMYYAAFVAGTNYGTIQNVTVKNCEIIANRQCISVGTIAGYNYGGTINSCHANNITFTGYGDMGGIAGTTAGGTISGCTTNSISMTLSIDTVNRSAGGLVAYAYNNASIKNCSVSNLTLSFGTYQNIANTEVRPVMGYVVAYLQDSSATGLSATNCNFTSYGTLPERTGWFLNYHYPREYICSSDGGKIGYKNNSTVTSN